MKQLPIALDRWCKKTHGPSAYAKVKNHNAYGWVCVVDGKELPISVLDAARLQYSPRAKVAYRDWNDPYSWYAYLDESSPNEKPGWYFWLCYKSGSQSWLGPYQSSSDAQKAFASYGPTINDNIKSFQDPQYYLDYPPNLGFIHSCP
jgi:hypothetical protein